jgi:hypothetical protein
VTSAAPTTIEAVMYELRTDGTAAFQTPGGRRRFSELTDDQVREVVKRLIYCRTTYPGRDLGITDDLLLKLDEHLS